MKVLIIGGTGLTGPHIVRGLAEVGHEVTVFHRGQTRAELPRDIREVLGDKAELADHRREFERLEPDVVLNMAAFTFKDAQLFVETFKGITGRCVVISSADVYLAYGRLHATEPGPPEPLPLIEDSALRAKLGPEGEAYNKTAVEEVLREQSDLPATIIRYPAIWGPGDHFHRFYSYFQRIADARPTIVIGDGESRFHFPHAYCEDAAHAVVLAITSEAATGRVYNVSEVTTPTGMERLTRIAETLGWQGQIVLAPDEELPPHLRQPPINLEQHLVLDSSRIRSELGFSEVIRPDEAIRRAYAWHMENPPPNSLPPDYAAEDALVKRWG